MEVFGVEHEAAQMLKIMTEANKKLFVFIFVAIEIAKVVMDSVFGMLTVDGGGGGSDDKRRRRKKKI